MDTGGTEAATRQGYPDTSNWVIALVPLTPRLTLHQKRSRPMPKGETTPIPLMTTRGEALPLPADMTSL